MKQHSNFSPGFEDSGTLWLTIHRKNVSKAASLFQKSCLLRWISCLFACSQHVSNDLRAVPKPNIKIFDETTWIEGPSEIADITKDSTKRDVRQAESLALVDTNGYRNKHHIHSVMTPEKLVSEDPQHLSCRQMWGCHPLSGGFCWKLHIILERFSTIFLKPLVHILMRYQILQKKWWTFRVWRFDRVSLHDDLHAPHLWDILSETSFSPLFGSNRIVSLCLCVCLLSIYIQPSTVLFVKLMIYN